MLGIVVLVLLGLVVWGLWQYLNAVRQGRGAEWRAAWRRARQDQKRGH